MTMLLKFEDFDVKASNTLRKLRDESEFCDISLRCADSDGQSLKAHRIILASFSPMFRGIFLPNIASTPIDDEALYLPYISHIELKAILDFIYLGEVKIGNDRLRSLLAVADILQIDGLTDARISENNQQALQQPYNLALEQFQYQVKEDIESTTNKNVQEPDSSIEGDESFHNSSVRDKNTTNLLNDKDRLTQSSASGLIETTNPIVESDYNHLQAMKVCSLSDQSHKNQLKDCSVDLGEKIDGQSNLSVENISCTATTEKKYLTIEDEKYNDFDVKSINSEFESVYKVKQDLSINAFSSKLKSVQCLECHKNFSSKNDLKRHFRGMHSKIKDIECEECHLKFSRKDNLIKHTKNVHAKIRGFECDTCNHKCSQKANLMKHIKSVHAKLKDIECGECGKMFSQKSDLTRHIKIVHFKIKDFECSECEKRFCQNQDLAQHVINVHKKIKSFECPECSHKSSKKSSLISHFKKLHNNKKMCRIVESIIYI